MAKLVDEKLARVIWRARVGRTRAPVAAFGPWQERRCIRGSKRFAYPGPGFVRLDQEMRREVPVTRRLVRRHAARSAALICAAVFCALLAVSRVQAIVPAASAVDTIAALEAIDADRLFDYHGNANPQLQRLMVLRFDATAAVIAAVDRLESNPRRAQLVQALYAVLGVVKDPESIAWLREKLRTQPRLVRDHYMPHWRDSFDGYGSWEWLQGRQRWVEFWISAGNAALSPRTRYPVLDVLSGFDDPPVVRHFLEQRERDLGPKATLAVEAYLSAHGHPTDAARIQSAIRKLAGKPGSAEYLSAVATEMRDATFVPYLISVTDVPSAYTYPTRYPARDALQAITFDLAPKTQQEWRDWYAAHGSGGRQVWIDRALDAFRLLLRADEDAALQRFDDAVYCWNDIAIVTFIESELVSRPKFHSAIAGWINLTYSAALRARLEPLARQISADPEALEDWARNLLQGRGFLPSDRVDSWETYVQMMNTRV